MFESRHVNGDITALSTDTAALCKLRIIQNVSKLAVLPDGRHLARI